MRRRKSLRIYGQAKYGVALLVRTDRCMYHVMARLTFSDSHMEYSIQ